MRRPGAARLGARGARARGGRGRASPSRPTCTARWRPTSSPPPASWRPSRGGARAPLRGDGLPAGGRGPGPGADLRRRAPGDLVHAAGAVLRPRRARGRPRRGRRRRDSLVCGIVATSAIAGSLSVGEVAFPAVLVGGLLSRRPHRPQPGPPGRRAARGGGAGQRAPRRGGRAGGGRGAQADRARDARRRRALDERHGRAGGRRPADPRARAAARPGRRRADRRTPAARRSSSCSGCSGVLQHSSPRAGARRSTASTGSSSARGRRACRSR